MFFADMDENFSWRRGMNEWEAFRESMTEEDGRWEKLRGLIQKLRMVLENPRMRPSGDADLLEQVESRLLEASTLFPAPDWLDLDLSEPAGAERYFANHVGEFTAVMLRVMELLQETTAEE